MATQGNPAVVEQAVAQPVDGTSSEHDHAATNGVHEHDSAPGQTTASLLEGFQAQIDELRLPVTAADASVISTPLLKPLDTSLPKPRPAPTADQVSKYDALLERVSKWTEVPTGLASGSPTQPIEAHERMFLTRECLYRYLRATNWKLDQTEQRLRNTLAWRREYGVDTKLKPDYTSIENETGKQVNMGYDIEGRPCHYLRPSKQNTERSPRQIEHLVFMLERTIDLMPPGQETLALLINFAETKQGQGASLAQGRETMYILQNHYPERLGRALVSNVPWLAWGFFKLIAPFIDPVTKEKVKFNEDVRLHVPAEQLMTDLNGKVNFDYKHEMFWPALIKLTDLRRAAYRTRWEAAGSRIGEFELYLRGGDHKSLAETEQAAS